MLHVVFVIEEAALIHIEIPDFFDCGVESHHRESERTIVVLDRGLLLQHANDVLGQRDIVAEHFDVVIGEADLDPGLVAASLLRGASGKNSHGGGTEAFEDVLDSAAKAVAVGEQENDGRDAPCHPGHSEKGAAKVVPHGRVGLLEQVAIHDEYG